MGRLSRLAWTGMALVALVSCRAHETLCSGRECSAVSAAGAGAGGEPSAGRAGAEAIPECSRDRDCQNDSVCDGAERCREGACSMGEAVSCELGTRCVEGSGACEYAQPSPWLLIAGEGRV